MMNRPVPFRAAPNKYIYTVHVELNTEEDFVMVPNG